MFCNWRIRIRIKIIIHCFLQLGIRSGVLCECLLCILPTCHNNCRWPGTWCVAKCDTLLDPHQFKMILQMVSKRWSYIGGNLPLMSELSCGAHWRETRYILLFSLLYDLPSFGLFLAMDVKEFFGWPIWVNFTRRKLFFQAGIWRGNASDK